MSCRSGSGFTVAVLLSSLFLPTAATAENYNAGAVGFRFQQLPWGEYAGEFQASGRCLSVSPMPSETEQVVGGQYVTVADTTTAFWYAATLEADQTVDLALLWVRRAGYLIPQGDYPVDALGRTVMFVFVDGITDFTPPVDPVGFAPAEWLDGLTCEHLFLAIAGTVHIQMAGLRGFDGTFDGTALDTELMLAEFSDGMFELEGVCIANEAANWGSVKAAFR